MSDFDIFVTGAPTGKVRYVVRDSHIHTEVDYSYIQNHREWFVYAGYTDTNGIRTHYYVVPDIEDE